MLVGINWTSYHALPVIKKLLQDRKAEFCEILIDNFLNFAPELIRDCIGDFPVGLHIMRSLFLEKSENELLVIGKKLKKQIDILKPLYVSDHLAQFTYQGRVLPLLAELDYEKMYPLVKSKVLIWQDILNYELLFENFPSSVYHGNQVDFYNCLISDTHCKLLFDFSNAIIAEQNCGFSALTWEKLINDTCHFHVAGYRKSDTIPSLFIDSHDSAISPETFNLISYIFAKKEIFTGFTMVVERDTNIVYELWGNELLKLKQLLFSKQ